MLSHRVKRVRALPGAATLLAACLAAPEARLAEIADPPAMEWERTFAEPGKDYFVYTGRVVEQTPDGGYIVLSHAAWVVNAGCCPGGAITLLRLDKSGETLWSKSYGGEYERAWTLQEQGYAAKPLCQTHDGGFAAVARRGSPVPVDSYVCRFDERGELLWEKPGEDYETGKKVWGATIQETADGGLIICGLYDFRPSVYYGFLLKTDGNGNKTWLRAYPSWEHEDSVHEIFAFVEETSDGGYIAAGYSRHNPEDNKLYLMRTDGTGQPKWSQRFEVAGQGDAVWVHETKEGRYLVCARRTTNGPIVTSVLLIQTDGQGNLLWERSYDSLQLRHRAHIAAETSDGGCVMTASTGGFLRVLRADAVGNELWSCTLGEPKAGCGASIQQTIDGGYIVTGQVVINDGQTDGQIYLAKLAPDVPRSAFARGDADASGELNITDAVVVLSYLFQSGPAPTCQDAADSDDNGAVNITDPIYVLGRLFLGGPAPADPFGKCGPDPTDDSLTCESYGACD